MEKALDVFQVLLYILGLFFVSYGLLVSDYESLTVESSSMLIIRMLLGITFLIFAISIKSMILKITNLILPNK